MYRLGAAAEQAEVQRLARADIRNWYGGIFEVTGNPIFAWLSVLECHRGELDSLPKAVRCYLFDVAEKLTDLPDQIMRGDVSPDDAMQRVPAALGLVSKGKNSLKNAKGVWTDLQCAVEFGDAEPTSRVTSEALCADLGAERGMSGDQFRKAKNRGLEMLAAKPTHWNPLLLLVTGEPFSIKQKPVKHRG